MANQYLESQLKELNLKESVHTAVQSAVHSVIGSFILNLSKLHLVISEKRQRFKPKQAKVEESPVVKPKPDKKNREEYFKEMHKKVEESKEFTKKLEEEKTIRLKRIQEREREMRMKAIQEIEEQRARQAEMERKLEEEKQKKISELMQKNENRKKNLEEVKQDITKRTINSKPLYKQMEDAYKQQVLMPQLEQHKAELAKKRILYQPLDHNELKEHLRKHEETKREQEYRRKKELRQKILEAEVNSASSNLNSKFTFAVLDEEKRKKEELEKIKEERHINANKRLQYSKLVKEMFPPVIDEGKKFDPDPGSKSRKNLKRAFSGDGSREQSIEKKKISVADYKSEIGSIPRRHWKKNPLVPGPKEIREAKIVDYLSDRRKDRDNQPTDIKPIHIDLQQDLLDDNFDNEKAKKIKAKAELVDRAAKKQERLLVNMKDDGVKGIEAGDQVNDMILSSIKAKLALLDKFNTK